MINIPPYTPELNACEQIWKYIKDRFEKRSFGSLEHLKEWLNQFVAQMKEETIKSIVSNHNYLNAFLRVFYL